MIEIKTPHKTLSTFICFVNLLVQRQEVTPRERLPLLLGSGLNVSIFVELGKIVGLDLTSPLL